VIPELIAQYVDTGKVRFVSREFPLTSIHPLSEKAAEAAVCAGKQDKYWEMHEQLFANQDEWTAAEGGDPTGQFKTYAKELGLDTAAFGQCLDAGEAANTVQGDLMAGQAAGVNATPYFFVNDLPVQGGLPIDALGQVIDYVAAGGTPPEIVPAPDDWHLRGNVQTAKAITVAFVDYANAESGQHAREVLPELLKTYIDTGQLIYILHPWSEGEGTPSAQAAAAAECAGQQGKFWEMHGQLFAEQDTWTSAADPNALFGTYAESLELDTDEFATCLDSDWAKLRVQAGNVVGTLYGVPAAPVFLFNNGSAQQGSPTFDEFKSVIDSIISGG
jgi:protein-disulfide isomerase